MPACALKKRNLKRILGATTAKRENVSSFVRLVASANGFQINNDQQVYTQRNSHAQVGTSPVFHDKAIVTVDLRCELKTLGGSAPAELTTQEPSMSISFESDTDVLEICPGCNARKTKALEAHKFIVGVLTEGKCDRCTYSTSKQKQSKILPAAHRASA